MMGKRFLKLSDRKSYGLARRKNAFLKNVKCVWQKPPLRSSDFRHNPGILWRDEEDDHDEVKRQKGIWKAGRKNRRVKESLTLTLSCWRSDRRRRRRRNRERIRGKEEKWKMGRKESRLWRRRIYEVTIVARNIHNYA